MPQAPVLRNTCHGPRTSIPQRVGCLPPHTDRVQQDVRPTDSPAPPAQKSGNTTEGAMSKPTANEDDPRAQPAAVGAWDNYVDPHPDGDKPRPRELPRHRLLRRHTPAAAEMRKQQDGRRRGRPPSAAHHRRRAGKLRQPAYRRRRATAEGRPHRPLPPIASGPGRPPRTARRRCGG